MTTPPRPPEEPLATADPTRPDAPAGQVGEWRWPLIAFMVLIAALAGMATVNDESSQLYFGVIGLLVVLGAVSLLAVLARGAPEGRERSYFGAIATLLASVAGLTGGIAGGAVVGEEQGETAGRQAGERVAANARRTATDAAEDTARRTATETAEDAARRAARRTVERLEDETGEGSP